MAGQAWAKVRGLFNDKGQPIAEARPGTPVEILGWRELPHAGDQILEVDSEKKAHSVLHFRHSERQISKAANDLDAIRIKEEQHIEEYRSHREACRQAGRFRIRSSTRPKETKPDDNTPKVCVILKGDVDGSVEAILDVLATYDSHDNCKLNIIHYGVGDVNDGDIELSKSFGAIIYAFSVNYPTKIPKAVQVKPFDIIYRLVDDLKSVISAKLPMLEIEETLGEANVLQIFEITEGKNEVSVLGCRCVKGVLKKNARYKLMRQGELIYDGK